MLPSSCTPGGTLEAAKRPDRRTVATPQGHPLNVRSAPGVRAPVVTQLPRGTLLTILAESDDGNWLRIETPKGDTGWVSAAYVQVPSAWAATAQSLGDALATALKGAFGLFILYGIYRFLRALIEDDGNYSPSFDHRAWDRLDQKREMKAHRDKLYAESRQALAEAQREDRFQRQRAAREQREAYDSESRQEERRRREANQRDIDDYRTRWNIPN